MIHLLATITNTSDFSGFKFYINGGQYFDVNLFCEAYDLLLNEINENDVVMLEEVIKQTDPAKYIQIDFIRN